MKKRQGYKWIKPEGNLICLIPTCNNLRQKYKNRNKLRKYCKDHQAPDMWEFCSWPAIRMKALERDDYTCVKCGKQPLKDTTLRGQKTEPNSSALIGDHIIPISLGGEEFDIDNVQTLCIPCDKIKTRQDKRDIAKARRDNYKNKEII